MIRELGALTRRELLRLSRNPQAIITSLLLPILYLILFGQAFNIGAFFQNQPDGHVYLLIALRGAPTYFSYFAAGMAGFVAVTATLFIGANVIFDRLFGILKRTAASPATATEIFGSRLLAGMIQPVGLAFLVLGLAVVLGDAGLSGLKVTSLTVVGAAEIVVAIVVISAMFASLFLAIGFTIEQPQTYFAVVNAINLPVLLTSAALYPWGTMPAWFQSVASYNPITLAVNVLRENMFAGASGYYPYGPGVYLLGLLGWAVAMFILATVLARRALAPRA
ncbi:MAG TPA: ABC transporter permease [Thermoplasmata archaeon]|nr:ABC transporter permease [Thermoplasmata archaeon]